jgi:hypothetical protein
MEGGICERALDRPPPGEAELAGADGGGCVEIFLPPTAEMRCFARLFDRLLALGHPRAGAVARVVAGGMVTPIAHFANLSLDFQTYLFLVFHRRRPARVTHAVLQPLTLVALAAGLAAFRIHRSGPPAAPYALDLNGAWIAGALLAVGYAAQGIANGMPLLAGVMAAVALGSAAAGTLVFSITRGAGRGAGASIVRSPWAWVVALSFVVMLSHLPEPLLPPRFNGLARWTRLPDLFVRPEGGLRPAGALVEGGARVLALGVVWGTVNEIWGFWRLTPVSVLLGLWSLGYQPARRARVVAAVEEAIARGNPALDFIGTGGATPLAAAVRGS